jgi:hypothetical protein
VCHAFSRIKKCETLVLESFWKFWKCVCTVSCVHTALCVHMGVYACVVRVGLQLYCVLGVAVSLGNFSRKDLFFIVHSNYAASSNRASVSRIFPVPRICWQYQSHSSYTNRVSNQIFDDVMGIWNLKKYFANSLSSLSKIRHCRPVLKFWKRIHNTWKKYTLCTIQKKNNKRGKLGDVVYMIHLEKFPRLQ